MAQFQAQAMTQRGNHIHWLIKLLILMVSAFLLAAFFMLRDGFQNLSGKPYQLLQPQFSSWAQVFENPSAISATPLMTGIVDGDRFIVFDESDTNLKNIDNRYETSVVMSYLIHHPSKGDYLIDAGLSKAFSTVSGNYNHLMDLILKLIGAHPEQTMGASAAERLTKTRPQAIFLTHLHADHTSGVIDFDKSTSIVFGKGELTFMQKAMMGEHLSGKELFTLDFKQGVPMPPFEKAIDLLGDGSFWAISTPGHSPSHISYLVNAETGPVLITGDAAAYYSQLKYNIRPNPGVHDIGLAINSLSQISAFLKMYPETKALVGHEMFVEHWAEGKSR